MKYLLIDTANMFFRARHVAFRASDPWEKVGYALHISMAAINKVAKQFDQLILYQNLYAAFIPTESYFKEVKSISFKLLPFPKT